MYTFRPAIREQVTLLIGLVGSSGSGKTYSAMRLASGMVGKGNRFAVIDTEARRSLHYADMFNFDMAELRSPFRPSAYSEAIKTADDAGYKVIIVDSCSLEWGGEGGILDWQEEELTRMAGDDYRKREACKMASWIKPKMAHKQMIQKILQLRSTLILCFRAEEKIGMEKDKNGKTVIAPKGWQPICEKSLPYELTVSFLLTPDKPGYPQPLKLQEQHKSIFPLDKPINEESGVKVSEWAKGKPPLQETDRQITDLIKALQGITSLSHLKKWREKNRDEVNSLPANFKKEITSAWLKREAELKEEYKGKKELEHDQQPEASESLIQADKYFDSIRQKDPVNFDIARINAGIKEDEITNIDDFEKFMICYNELTER